MRRAALLGALAVLLMPACSAPDHRGAPVTTMGPQLAHVPDNEGMPDLIVDEHDLATSWVVYDEKFTTDMCDAQEGDVTPGEHRVLRLTVTTPNVGTADLYVGDPNTHIDPNGDGDFSDSDGLYEFATCHHHYHFRHYATYQLIALDANGNEVGTPIKSAKRGFCMIDVAPYNSDLAGAPKSWVYRSCGRVGVPGNQGISVGYGDQYYKWLQGQYFVLDGGDGQAVVPPGRYRIKITVNPGFVPKRREPCRYADPNHVGVCHQLPESNYENNVAFVDITIPDRTGKTGYGPGGSDGIPNDVNKKTEEDL